MNFAKGTVALAFFVAVFESVAAWAADTIDYGKANPPWKPGKYYRVVSRYEMTLDGIVMDVKKFRKAYDGWIFHHDEKQKEHWYSSPFSGRYSCYLHYVTQGTHFANKNNGSTFRDYITADITFQPLDETGKTVLTDAEPSWLRRVLFGPRSEEVANAEIAEKLKDADFMFKEIFMADGENLDTQSRYFLSWNQRSAFKGDLRHHMNVFKKPRDEVPDSWLLTLSSKERARIIGQAVGSGPSSGWFKTTDIDLGYNIAQAEAKMMTYAIYGQEETRNVGDVWAIDSDTLESFFPLQSKGRKPFSFSGGVLVLTVESDDNGIVTVKSLPSGRVDGQHTRTDLAMRPRTEESEHAPNFRVDMWNEAENYVRFKIDSFNEVCLRAEMQTTLRDYSGAVPKVEQLSLNDPDHRYGVTITDGSVVLHCEITTSVEDMSMEDGK